MKKFVDSAYHTTILKYPALTLILLGLILAFFATGTKNFKLDASIDALILENDKDLATFRQMMMRYESQEFIFIALKTENDFLSDEHIDVTSKMRDKIAEIPQVMEVVSMLDVPLVRNDPETTLGDLAANFKTLRMPNIDLERAREELTKSPFYQDLVVSSDGKVASIAVYFKPHAELPRLRRLRDELLYQQLVGELSAQQKAELKALRPKYETAKEEAEQQTHQALVKIRQIIASYQGQAGIEIFLGGLPMIVDDVTAYIKGDLVNFGAGVLLFLILMLSIIFREPRWVILPFASCLYAGITMVGLLGLVGWKVTVISSNFIALMLIITMSMNVHLTVRYRELVRDFPELSQKDLVRLTIQKMVRPCLYTAITTIIAFSSLVVADIKPVIDFGWMMTIGLAVVFLTSFSLFPSLLLLTQKKVLDQVKKPKSAYLNVTASIGRFTERNGKIIFIASLVLALTGLAGIQRLEVENSFVSYFDDSTDIYRGLALIDKQLGGTTPVDILLKFPPEDIVETEDDDLAALFGDVEGETSSNDPECVNTICDDSYTWFTAKKINRIKQVHKYLETIPELGKVMSLASTIEVAETVKGSELEPFELNIANQRLPAAVRAQIIDPYVSFTNNEARITVRIIDTYPNLKRRELLERIDTALSQEMGLSPEDYEISGLLVLYNNVLQSLFKSQILTLGTVMLGILITLIVLFRSVSVAIIGIIPNILAATIILGFMGWMNIPLDIMTITIAAITIGIAVDNCIHYLYRFKIELPRTNNAIQTMHYCHDNIAKALFYTTVTIVFGFSILMLSNFIPTILFGLLTAIAMVVALLAALTLMPRLILLWRPFDETPIEDL